MTLPGKLTEIVVDKHGLQPLLLCCTTTPLVAYAGNTIGDMIKAKTKKTVSMAAESDLQR